MGNADETATTASSVADDENNNNANNHLLSGAKLWIVFTCMLAAVFRTSTY